MKLLSLTIAIAMTATACASDPPGCQQAIDHFYDVSVCTFVDTSTGTATDKNTAINTCTQISTAAPSECIDKLNAWLVCTDSTPAHATNAQCTGCSDELQLLLECR